jgi:hypothetical protein
MIALRCPIRLFLIVLLVSAGSASAQTADERPTQRIEATVGGLWLGGASLGSSTAELRANRTGTPAPFTLFTTESRFGSTPGLDARVSYGLTKTFAVEFGLVYSRPEVRTRVDDDVENAPELTVAEPVEQYFIDGSLVMLLDRFAIGGRTVPFVSGGAGYLRQLHEGQTLVESGQVYHLGGGVKHWLALHDRGFVRGAGIRVDGRLYLLVKGIELEDRVRPHGAISGSFFVTF